LSGRGQDTTVSKMKNIKTEDINIKLALRLYTLQSVYNKNVYSFHITNFNYDFNEYKKIKGICM
jgi:hypothetical protein